MDGLETVMAVMEGRLPLPPIDKTMGFEPVHAERGKAVFTWTPDESVLNHAGTVMGGVLCTLLDAAIGCALHTTMPEGKASRLSK